MILKHPECFSRELFIAIASSFLACPKKLIGNEYCCECARSGHVEALDLYWWCKWLHWRLLWYKKVPPDRAMWLIIWKKWGRKLWHRRSQSGWETEWGGCVRGWSILAWVMAYNIYNLVTRDLVVKISPLLAQCYFYFVNVTQEKYIKEWRMNVWTEIIRTSRDKGLCEDSCQGWGLVCRHYSRNECCTPFYGSPLWFLGKSQPFRPWLIYTRVKYLQTNAMSWSNLSWWRHIFFCKPWLLMRYFTNLLNSCLSSVGMSSMPLFYSWSI